MNYIPLLEYEEFKVYVSKEDFLSYKEQITLMFKYVYDENIPLPCENIDRMVLLSVNKD